MSERNTEGNSRQFQKVCLSGSGNFIFPICIIIMQIISTAIFVSINNFL